MASSSNEIVSEHPLRVLKKKQKNKEYEENEGIELCYLYIVNTLAQITTMINLCPSIN